MSRMSMPFGGRTITTSVSGGDGRLRALVAVLVLLVGAGAAGVFFEQYAATIETVLTVVASLALAGVLSPIAYVLLGETVTWPRERRRVVEFRRHCEAVEAERAACAVAAEKGAVALDAGPVFGRGLDGARDGRLIDATGRFRSLGTFLPADDDHDVIDAEIVDHPTVDRSTALDREV